MRILSFFIAILICFNFHNALATDGSKRPIADFKLIAPENKLKIVALTDNTDQVDTKIAGNYPFSMNGIDLPLKFMEGEAAVKQNFSGSTFVYFHPESNALTSVKLYYLLKTGDSFWPIKIPVALLLIIPAIFFIIGYFVRKLIFLFIGIILAFFVFNSGLGVGSYFEVIGKWLLGLF